MTIDDMDGVRERLARCADEHGLLSRADLRALLDDHARLRAEVASLTRERDEYKACWFRDVEKGRAAEERLRAERVASSAAWSISHAALVADRDRLAAALAETREAAEMLGGYIAACRLADGCFRMTGDESRTLARLESILRDALAATPADLATARDARVRAEALREAAAKYRQDEVALAEHADVWLRAEAERAERGGR